MPTVTIDGQLYGPADRTPSGLSAAAVVADWATTAKPSEYAAVRRWLAQWPEGPQLRGAQQAAAASVRSKARVKASRANGAANALIQWTALPKGRWRGERDGIALEGVSKASLRLRLRAAMKQQGG